MAELRCHQAGLARVLEFIILTAARKGEVFGATWQEFDLDAKIWTVPAGRMKARRSHRVPLADAALSIIEARPRSLLASRVFLGSKDDVWKLLQGMGRGNITTHGFRSTFRDWAGDMTDSPREIIEAALAHVIGDRAEQAYRRGDALEKRRALMSAWAAYCAQPSNVVTFARGA